MYIFLYDIDIFDIALYIISQKCNVRDRRTRLKEKY